MIIGISGKKQVGKDTVATIIKNFAGEHWKNKKFGSGPKDIVCYLTGCTREQLEDENFKRMELKEEWWYYKHIIEDKIISIEDWNKRLEFNPSNKYYYTLIKPTYRSLLEKVGTEAGRDVIHPDLWVNMAMRDYIPIDKRTMQDPDDSNIFMPNWIFSDVRFPNEAKIIKDNNGILIRILRNTNLESNHLSNTALDNYYRWDYVIDNNDTIFALEKKVETILIREKIIRNED